MGVTFGIGAPAAGANQGSPAAGTNQSAGLGHPAKPLRVMTRNLYLGADLTPLVSAPPQLLNQAVVGVLANVELSNPPARMNAVAAEIDQSRPDVVDLQEAADWTIAAIPPYTQAASYDFTALILQRLTVLGDSYKVAVSQDNFDSNALNVTLPGRFIDRDVILVKSSVRVLDTGATHFSDQLTYSGTPKLPLVVGGDMNSDPAIAASAAAADNFAAAGYVDQYSALDLADPGYTCCRNATLTGGTLDQRIDHIYAVGSVVPRSATITGLEPISTTEPMWPSDHAGLVIRMLVAH